MASTLDFVEYAVDQLSGAGTITYKRMFGEFGMYCDGKYFACVCDNKLFVKITEPGRALLPDCPTAPPYKGGSPMFLLEDLENTALLQQVTLATCRALPAPKPKKPKK